MAPPLGALNGERYCGEMSILALRKHFIRIYLRCTSSDAGGKIKENKFGSIALKRNVIFISWYIITIGSRYRFSRTGRRLKW